MTTTTSQPRGKQLKFTKQLEDIDFAYDISMLPHTYQHMQDKIQELANIARSAELSINTSKTKGRNLDTTLTNPILIKD